MYLSVECDRCWCVSVLSVYCVYGCGVSESMRVKVKLEILYDVCYVIYASRSSVL